MKIYRDGENRTTIQLGISQFFFSYSTCVAGYSRKLAPDTGWSRTDERHSVTTSKHIGQYLRDSHGYKGPVDMARVTTVTQEAIDAHIDAIEG